MLKTTGNASQKATWLLLGAVFACSLPAAAQEDETSPGALPAVSASKTDVSVVGVSSGGYMAMQLAVAWPERFTGVGVLAAGPWSCAQGSLSLALNQCMMTRRGLPSLKALDTRWEKYRELEYVGSESARSQLRAYVWHGENDSVVAPALGDLLAEQLRQWLADEEQLNVARSPDAGHGWPVKLDNTEVLSPPLGDCQSGGGSHLLACDENIAADMLDWLHPDAVSSAKRPAASGQLIAFDQGDFDAKGLADSGYVYLPEGCQGDGNCEVTIALHGCQMNAEQLGEIFVRNTGLNEWADQQGRIIVYPQAESTLANPQGCWDWWGFAESSWQLHPLHDTRQGTQVSALMAMLTRLQSTAAEAETD